MFLKYFTKLYRFLARKIILRNHGILDLVKLISEYINNNETT